MKKSLMALAVTSIFIGPVAQAAEISVGGAVQMFLYLNQDMNADDPEVENGDVELALEASEQAGGQTGYVKYRLDGGLKGDALSTGKSTAGVKGAWGDLSIGSTTDLTDWGQYGNDIYDVGHTFERGSLGYVRDFGGMKLGIGYTPGQNVANQVGNVGDTDSILGVGLEIAAGAYTIGFNTQDAETTLGIKGLLGNIEFGLHYIDVDGAADEIIGFKIAGKSGAIDLALSYNGQGDEDETRLDVAYPIAGALEGVARFQSDFSRVGLAMEF